MGILKAAFTVAQIPSKTALSILQQFAQPAIVEGFSTAIAKGAFQTVDSDSTFSVVDGLSIDIEYNDERLLATGGIATAITLGTVYWLGVKLQMQVRYAELISTLESLKIALASGDDLTSVQLLAKIDDISNPLLDPKTFKPIDNADEVADIYSALFNKKAVSGSMFNASTFTTKIDDGLKIGSRVAILAAGEATESVIEVTVKRAAPFAGRAVGRVLGGVLWVDTIWWVATSAIDLGLNYTGIEEKNQRIPILADIPFIGGLFDLSETMGSSAVDLVLTPIIDGVISFFFDDEEVDSMIDAFWGVITSAALNPSITPFLIAILEFYIENIDINVSVPASWDLETLDLQYGVDILGFRPEPLDILILWFYAITLKVVVMWWIIPSFNFLIKKAPN